MEGKQAFGMALLLMGLLLFVAAILGRAGATLAALTYGDVVLKPSPGAAPPPPKPKTNTETFLQKWRLNPFAPKPSAGGAKP